jgi:hypothetical protein
MNPLQSITAELARIKGLTEAATPGPWTSVEPTNWLACDGPIKFTVKGPPADYWYLEHLPDALHIADSRTSVPRLAAALEVAVETLNMFRMDYPGTVKVTLEDIASKLCPAGEEGK